MEIYIIDKKENFNEGQIKRIEKCGKVVFIEEEHNMFEGAYTKSDEEKIIAINPDLIGWNLQNDVLDRITNLKAICLMSTSYSYVDIEYCKNRNIVVTNVPNYSTDSVAEYAVFLMLSISRKLPIQIKGEWKENFTDEFCGMQIKGKTAAILGLGHIGERLADILKGMGMNVIYWSKNTRNDKYIYKEIDEIFKEADFIFPTFLINDETKKIITDDRINSMKNNASIITIVGTEIFNKDLVLEKVKNNTLYGLAFENSNDNINNYEGNVLVTSPYAWYTVDSLSNCIEIWVNSIEGIANNEVVNNVN